MNVSSLEGKTAIVTGAAGGIGREVSAAVSAAGAHVVAVDRDAQGLEETSSLADTGRIAPLPLDLLAEGAETRVVEGTLDAHGGMDVLVNCAGIFPTSPALELETDEWDRVLGLNLRAPFLLSQAFARHAARTGNPGNVVNIASSAGVIARPGIAHYCASKAGLMMLTKVLAIEWAEHDIRVNAVAPGLIGTPGVEELLRSEESRHEHRKKLTRIPMSRTGTPQEIAEAVLYLASDASSFVTGHTLFVDGGYSAGHTFRD